MSTVRYTTAASITDRFVNPAYLAPEAVRYLLVRPLPRHGSGVSLFLAEVVFHDGTMHPIAPPGDRLDIHRYCQRLSALYDWPVHDGLSAGAPYPSTTGEIVALPLLNQGEREAMRLIGHGIADELHAGSVPFAQAIDQAKDQLAAFVALSVVEGGLERDAAREAAVEALNAAVERLARLESGH